MPSSRNPLIINSERGLYCPQGDFHIDPHRSVRRALITHAHSDHARSGSNQYLTAADGLHVLRARLGPKACIETLAYGEPLSMGGVTVSFHPAGHVLGSAQVRLEYQGRVWVVSGDFKTRPDPTCKDFELVRCHCFITESTFALPVFRWPDPQKVADDLNSWWAQNRRHGRSSIILAYSLGKAQRLLAMACPSTGPIFVDKAIDRMNVEYLACGISLPAYGCIGQESCPDDLSGALIVASPSVLESEWIQTLPDFSTAFASGWMQLRSMRRSQSVDRGFVLSDHADWTELLEVISGTGAEDIIVTHGYVRQLVRYLNEKGFRARAFHSHLSGKPAGGEAAGP
jgi:putative mRNA 3-end processing factor